MAIISPCLFLTMAFSWIKCIFPPFSQIFFTEIRFLARFFTHITFSSPTFVFLFFTKHGNIMVSLLTAFSVCPVALLRADYYLRLICEMVSDPESKYQSSQYLMVTSSDPQVQLCQHQPQPPKDKNI